MPSDGQMRGVSGRPHGQQATVLGGPRRPSAEPPSHRHAPCDVARSGPRRWRQTVWTPGLWTWGLLIPRSLWELDEASSEAGREWRREGRPCQLRAARTRRRPGEALLARGGQVQWSPPPGPAHLRRPSGGPWPPGPQKRPWWVAPFHSRLQPSTPPGARGALGHCFWLVGHCP